MNKTRNTVNLWTFMLTYICEGDLTQQILNAQCLLEYIKGIFYFKVSGVVHYNFFWSLNEVRYYALISFFKN